MTLGTGARIDGAAAGIYTYGKGDITLGDTAQINSSAGNGIRSSYGNSTINLGNNSQINASGVGISQSGNPVITLGTGSEINAGGMGIDNNFGGTATITLGSGAQINAGTFGVRSKYADLSLQSGAQINAGNVGVLLAYGSTDSAITLASGSSIVSTTAEAIRGNNGTGHDVVDNSGLLQGVGNAVNLRAGDDTLILRTGSQIVGNVQAGTGTDTFNLFGTGTEDANFQAFEIFDMNGADWTLSGTSVLGTGNINSGIFKNNGAITSNITVNSGATFGGTGATTGNVTNDGTDSPGDGGIGTQTITGNYVQGAGGALAVDVDGGGSTDLLSISGTATLAGNLNIATSGVIPNGAVYTVLQAPGGVAGSFGAVTDNLFFVNFTQTVNPTDVQITAARTLATAGQTATERNLSQILDQAISSGAAGTAAIDTVMNSISTSQQASDFLASQTCLIKSAAVHSAMTGMSGLANYALDRLNRFVPEIEESQPPEALPSANPAPPQAEPKPSEDFPPLTSDNFSGLNSIAPAAGETSHGKSHVWLQVTGGKGSVSGDSIARGNDYDSAGLAAGVETATDFDATMGAFVAGSRTRTDIDGLQDNATTDTYLIGAYGNWQPNQDWYLRGSLSGGYFDFRTKRPTLAGTATADFSGYGGFAYLETAYKTIETDHSYVAPLLALEGTVLQHQGYQETGAGVLNLTVDGETSVQFKTLLGEKLVAHFETGALIISPQLQAVWAHEFLDTYPDVRAEFSGAPSTSYENGGPRQSRDAARLGVNLSVSPIDGDYLTFYGGYNLNISQDAADHHLTGGFRMLW